MPNAYVACWTIDRTEFVTGAGPQRAGDLRNVALGFDAFCSRYNSNHTRILVVPEYFFADGTHAASRDDKHAIYRKLQDISSKVPKLILIAGTIVYEKGADKYNVCPVLYGGDIVKKLYKELNDGVYALNGQHKDKTDDGKGVPLVDVAGITIGLDICMDYIADRLGRYLTTHGLPRPDIHVQISAGSGPRALGAAAKVNGVYIHCNLGGGARGASAWRVTAQGDPVADATTVRIPPMLTSIPLAGGRVICYDMLI